MRAESELFAGLPKLPHAYSVSQPFPWLSPRLNRGQESTWTTMNRSSLLILVGDPENRDQNGANQKVRKTFRSQPIRLPPSPPAAEHDPAKPSAANGQQRPRSTPGRFSPRSVVNRCNHSTHTSCASNFSTLDQIEVLDDDVRF